MDTLLSSSLRAIRSLFAPGMFGVMVTCMLVTMLALVGFVGATGTFFAWAFENAWLAWVGGIGATVFAWFLFPGIMPVIVNFFGERIMGIIERNDYPAAAPARDASFLPELLHDAKFSVTTIGLNILVSPLYLVFGLNVIIFYLLNGYLLGREFFVMAARRHVPVAQAEILRKRHGRLTMIAGVALVVMATIPILNLLAPFWGIAVMTHLYHRLEKNTFKSIR